MPDDYMELGDTGLISTDYGFFNVITGEKFDHDGNVIEREDDDETTQED